MTPKISFITPQGAIVLKLSGEKCYGFATKERIHPP
jgi:hypothetical protein